LRPNFESRGGPWRSIFPTRVAATIPIAIAFFLDDGAIFKLAPRTPDAESGILSAFDAARDRIMEVAAKAYAHSRTQRFYLLAAADF